MLASTLTTVLAAPLGALTIHESAELSESDGAPAAPRLSLVIPTYNERPNVGPIVQRLAGLLDPVLQGSYELIVVDDDSPDRTWEVAQGLIGSSPSLRVVRREHERGLATAVVRGWQTGRGEILGVIDADLQHPPEVLIQLLGAIDAGADLAVASRHVEGGGFSNWSRIRRGLSLGARLLGRALMPGVVSRLTDPMSGYFLIRRSAIARRELSPVGYKILIEVLARGDVRSIAEVGYVFQIRQDGQSKVTWRQYVDYVRHLLRLRRGRKAR